MSFTKDEERIEEERAGIARPATRSLASSHLLQALNALDDACDLRALLSLRRSWPLNADDAPAAWRTLADIRQRDFCCTATLFAAFAAEGFVNDFLEVHLRPQVSARRFREVDRWSTKRKYVEAVEQAYARLFWEGDEVIPHLATLFEVRNSMVHARPGIGPPMAAMRDPDWRSTFSPIQVAEWLIAVAGAASSMEMRCYGFDYVSFPALAIWQGREEVRTWAKAAEPFPGKESATRPALVDHLNQLVGERNARCAGLRLTSDEVRDVRTKLARENGAWDAFTDMVLRQSGGRESGDA